MILRWGKIILRINKKKNQSDVFCPYPKKHERKDDKKWEKS